MIHLFVLVIYQPFFNLLVFLYWILEKLTGGNADMGIAVIILTLIIRFILLPLSFAGDKSEAERREISEKIAQIEREHASEPILQKQLKKQVLHKSTAVLVGEMVNLIIQIAIALMLLRIFNTGLTGEDLHLLYPFMPDVETPFNLVFWGEFDLTHTSVILNLTQSIVIFFMETLSMYYSPYPVVKRDVVRYQLFFPIVSFLVFMFLPAGKKLFIITTLLFSIVLLIIKIIRWKFAAYSAKKEAEELADPQDEKVIVDIK